MDAGRPEIFQKVKAVQDDSCHWYIIPAELEEDFNRDGEDMDFVDSGRFDEKYGEYDYVLKSWRGNHITLTKAGKAGHEFFIGDKQMTVEKKEESAEIKVVRTLDGINYAFTDQTSQIFDRVCGERDAARAEVTKLKGEILTDAKIDELVAAKIVERDNLAKVKAAYPTLDTAGKSADYVKALLDAAALNAPKKEEEKSDRAFVGELKDAEKPAMTARENFIKNNSGRRH